MELSGGTVDGVQVAGSSLFDDSQFQELVKCSVSNILEPAASRHLGMFIVVVGAVDIVD